MSFSWSLVLLIALTVEFWKYGDSSCVRQKYAKTYSNGHYKKLLKIDTGNSQEESLKWYDDLKRRSTEEAINRIYKNLLCSYMYNCSHYLNLIRPLLTTDGKDALKVLLGSGFPIFVFENQVVKMLNVLYNFGVINSVDHLWLVYMYSFSLKSILGNRTLNEDERDRVLLEHDNVYDRLVQYTSGRCALINNNVYNDQYEKSVYYKSPEEIRDNRISHEVIKDSVVKFKNTIDTRITEITKRMNIDNCTQYFRFYHLLVIPTLDDSVLRQLLYDFAEITPNRVFRLIKDTCIKSLDVKSFGTTTKHIAGCQNIFMNVMKYVMFFHSWKHVCQICQQLNSEWPTRDFAIRQIKESNVKMYEYFNTVLRILNLKVDEELETIDKLFRTSSAYKLANITENKQLESIVLAQLLEINTKYFQLPDDKFSIGKFTPKYLQDRNIKLNIMGNICLGYDFYILESELSFHVFRKFVKDSFKGIDFQVISSFNQFFENEDLQTIAVYI